MKKHNEKPLILAIDDDESMRMLFRAYLEDKDYRVIDCSSGKEGLEAFDKEKPDLVLTDLRLPGMDGLEVLETLKRIAPDTPTIIISGSGRMDDAIQAIRLGAWDYLEKPIVAASILYHTIEKSLERARLVKQNKIFRRKLEDKLQEIQEDEESGRKVQTGMLPDSAWNFNSYTFRHEILPSRSLSGDFVDYFKISETDIGFYFADVSGHGISSALITVLLKSFMAKHRDNYLTNNNPAILDPATLFSALNKELLHEKIDKHITLFYGILNTTNNSLLYCNAGQFPAPILNDETKTEMLTETNLPIGLFSFAEYHNTSLQLPSSFWLTIYSDGILDTLEQTGLDKKIGFLKTLKSERALNDLLQTTRIIKEFPDDITILSIEKTKEANE